MEEDKYKGVVVFTILGGLLLLLLLVSCMVYMAF